MTVADSLVVVFNITAGNRHGACANVTYGKHPKSYALDFVWYPSSVGAMC